MKIKANDLVWKTFKEFIGKIIIYFTAIILLLLFIKKVIRQMDFQWIYDYKPDLYYQWRYIFEFISEHGDIIIFISIIIVIGFLILLYKFLKKIINYINVFSNLADKLFEKNEEYISLPKERKANS